MTLYPGAGLYPRPGLYPGTTVTGGTARPATVTTLTWPPSDLYRQAVRSGSAAIYYTVSATLAGAPVAGAQDLRPVGGSITDTTKPGVRRTLSLDLAAEPGLFDKLSPIGTRLTVAAMMRLTDRSLIKVPMGVFDVDSERISEGSGGLSLTAPDRWVSVQRARFPTPTSSIRGHRVVDEIVRLLRGALGASTPVTVTATSTATVGTLTWEKDRDQAIIDLATGIGAWVFFDRLGVLTIADVPTVGANADWMVDASPTGVLLSLDRERSRSNTYNVVVVESSASDGPSFPTQFCWDADPASATYAGPGAGYGPTPPTSPGPFGTVPFFYDTPLPLTVSGARQAGRTILARVTGLASQASASSVVNPAMDAFHTLDVLPPKERYDIPRVLERHVVDTVTHPLSVSTAMTIEGRSTRSDTYISA